MSAPQQSAAALQARADEALAEFRRGAREIKQHSDQARQAIAGATAQATSRDGAVTVDVTIDGAVRGLSLGAAIASLTPDTLAAEVVATIRTATAQALLTARTGVSAALGDDNAAIAVLDRRIADVTLADNGPAADELAAQRVAPPADQWQGRG